MQTFLDRGQLQRLAQPTLTGTKRIPGLKLDNPRQLALMHALVSFSHVLAGHFTTSEIYPRVLRALGLAGDLYKLNSLRYDLSKLRAKALVEKLPGSRRYRLTAEGYRISLIYLKLFHKLYAPLSSAMIHPFAGDQFLPSTRTSPLDQLYRAVSQALDNLIREIGLELAA